MGIWALDTCWPCDSKGKISRQFQGDHFVGDGQVDPSLVDQVPDKQQGWLIKCVSIACPTRNGSGESQRQVTKEQMVAINRRQMQSKTAGFLFWKKILFDCPRCGATLFVSFSEQGNPTECPNCEDEFTVPRPT